MLYCNFDKMNLTGTPFLPIMLTVVVQRTAASAFRQRQPVAVERPKAPDFRFLGSFCDTFFSVFLSTISSISHCSDRQRNTVCVHTSVEVV